MFNIEWAPLFVPLERRLQTLAVIIIVILIFLAPLLITPIFIYYLLFGNLLTRIICTLYLMFIVSDADTGKNGGRGSGYKFLRKNVLWKYATNYFPVDLVKTSDLTPDRNYLFATFPHGVASFGVFCNFVSQISKFSEYFPGIRTKITTLNVNFYAPITRELVLGYGMAVASENCLKILLTASNDPFHSNNSDGYTSNAAVLIVGGAHEALYARPNNYQLKLKDRKGFIRIAMTTGSPLVPVFSFGEVDIYDQISNPPGSWLRRLQEYIKEKIGISPIIINGRGIFQYTFGLLPKREPITTVVGAPIEVIKNENPSSEDIDKVHQQFIDALIDLFENHKGKYIADSENIHLIIE